MDPRASAAAMCVCEDAGEGVRVGVVFSKHQFRVPPTECVFFRDFKNGTFMFVIYFQGNVFLWRREEPGLTHTHVNFYFVLLDSSYLGGTQFIVPFIARRLSFPLIYRESPSDLWSQLSL